MSTEKIAVMYGAGNVGRGFIGQLLYESGYRTVFVDVNEEVVSALNRRRAYPLRILAQQTHQDLLIENVSAVHGQNVEQVADAIAGADLLATAVGANVLPHIAPAIAAGLARRHDQGGAPLDILICENLMDAGQILRGLILAHLPEPAHRWFADHVGLVETSIGRMIPLQTPQLQDGDPLRICVEAYCALPADKEGFRAGIPALRGLAPTAPFSFYVERKLYMHNMGHALAAYCGDYVGLTTVWEAVETPEIADIVRGAMLSSADALARRFGADSAELHAHAEDLLARFANRQLGDSVYRVGRDLRRKLAPKDRMVGALRACMDAGIDGARIALGIALALRFSHGDLDLPAERVLTEVCGIDEAEPVYARILAFYAQARAGASLADLAASCR